jgi:hypothetical protein
MRVSMAAAGAVLASLVVATGSAIAGGAHTFHTPDNCLPVGGSRTVCFEAWGVDKLTTSASGNQLVSSHAHRRFTEFTNGVLTFEQRDMSHHLFIVKDGQAHVQNDMFAGWSTPGGLLCRWREHIVVRDGVLLHSVDEFSCS